MKTLLACLALGVLPMSCSLAAGDGHPRLYFNATELARLRGLRDHGVHGRIWRNLRASADWCLTRQPRTAWIAPVSPDPVYANLYDRFYAIMHDMAVMEHLAFAYAYSGDPRYGEAGRQWALAGARIWSREADGQPDGSKAYAVTRLLKGLTVAYDCLYPMLSESDRAELRGTISSIGQAYYDGYFTTPTIAGPGFHTHHAVVEWGSFGVAALAIRGEYPPAEAWLEATVTKFRDHLLPMGLAEDGAQVEGSTFWASTMHYRLFFLDAMRRVTGEDLLSPYLARLDTRLALAQVAAPQGLDPDEDQLTAIYEPSYGQLNYYSPVLVAMARFGRDPLCQALAGWDASLGAIQQTRYVTTNGEWLLFELGGYAYAWYDDTVPARVPAEAPLSFRFPSVNEAYLRASYTPGGIVAGVGAAQTVIHVGGMAVLVEMAEATPPALQSLTLTDDSVSARITRVVADGEGTARQTVRLHRPDRLRLRREGGGPLRFWCHRLPTRSGDTLRWPAAALTVTHGSLESVEPEGYRDEKSVGYGKLKLADPRPMTYPVITVLPDETGLIELEITAAECRRG